MPAPALEIEVHPLDAARRADFYAVHCPANGEGWCNCVAWWVPTWDGWGERTSAENRALRDRLFAEGRHDGFVAYVAGEPAGWCQVGPRDRLPKLVKQYGLPADPEVHAVTCFVVAPRFRGRGVARRLLADALADLARRGVKHVQAFPKRGTGLEPGAVWTGPEALFVEAGFALERDHARHPVYGKRL